MASVNLSGILKNPEGEPDVGAVVRFTLLTNTGETVQSSSSELIVPPDGAYDIDVVYGQLRVDYISDFSERFVAIVIVNQDTTATSLPELLNAVVPPTDAQLLEFQAILADCVTAQTAAEAAAASIPVYGTAATKDVRTSSTDTTTGRVLTQGNIGFEYQRHIKAAKQFTTGGLGVDEVFYLGTIKAGKHNIRFSTRGNFGFNNYEINLALSFDAAGTDGVSPHNGARIDSKIEGKGATEFLGFSTIKVDSQEAAVYLLYRDPSAVQSIYVGYDSFTADTIGVLPNKTETWTPISVATASSGTHEIPTLLEIDGNTAYFKGFQMYHSGNTNFNVFAIGSGVVLSTNGVGTSTTLVDTDIPLNSYSNPVSITNVGTGYNIQDVATGTLVASSVLPSLAPPSHAKNAIFRFAVSGATSGKRYRIIAAGATTSTVNF